MDFRHLRTFAAVAELRHFARAAGVCNLSQPAVSHQIAQLEAELGVRLLNRAARRVSLTVAGEVFLEEARRILAAVDRAHERMQEVARGAVGRIRLGATPTAGLYLLPPLLAAYRRAHPTFDLQLEIAAPHTLADRVTRNDLDMAILAGPLPAGELRARRLADDELVIIARPDAPLARARSVKARQLEDEAWVLREDGSDARRQLTSWWHRHRLAPARTCTFMHPDGVKRAVIAGLGIALVSKLTVADDLRRKQVAAVAMTTPLPSRPIVIVDHPQKHHGAACRAMLQALDAAFPVEDRSIAQ
jgi:DNA-binding transcriptional LysR family regulator